MTSPSEGSIEAKEAGRGQGARTKEESEESIAYLRERGVEIVLPGEHRATPAALPGAPKYDFVFISADEHVAVAAERAEATEGDGLKALLAPRFVAAAAIDEDTLKRESAHQASKMLVAGKDAATLTKETATVAQMQRTAVGGMCEAYPLCMGNEENGWSSVRLYIDEVGALRARPRNTRAEDLASAAGIVGLSIHGDAYVGRCVRFDGGERNQSFGVGELAHDSEWIVAARRANHRLAEQRSHAQEDFASGDQGTFYWTQTDDDVEVRVRAAPTGRGAAKRVSVSYGSGEALAVSFDKQAALAIPKLFARVTPDECTWTLDNGELVVSLEKVDRRVWASLSLAGDGKLL